VNCVCVGTVASPWVHLLVTEQGGSLDALVHRQPMGRLATPAEIGEAWLTSRQARQFVIETARVVDGGLTTA
jgi:NAD(P)-dependent dehydrogenase (short-subunit alcohol dehydrogenase family)